MKNVLITIVMMVSFVAMAKDEKIYTQKDFDEKIKKQVLRIKKKSVAELTNEILEKEKDLVKREKEIEEKQKQLELAEKSLLKQISSFEDKQKKIIGCFDMNKQNEQKRISQLVTTISNMKPVKAADLLAVQDVDISIKILEKIDPKRASKIFNLMDKEVSARLQKQYLNMRR